MCGSSAPPPPDPNVGIAAQQQVALGKDALDYAKTEGAKQDQLGQDYLDFAKNQFQVSQDKQDAFNKTVSDATNFYTGMAKDDQDRWNSVFKPLQDQFISTANEYADPAKQEEYAAQAKADVATAGAQERDANTRRMEAVGINPASGAYQGVDRALGLGTTAASVGAQNTARETVRNKALALQADAINMGSGLPAQAAGAEGAAVSTGAQPLAQLNASQGIVGAGYGGAFTGTGGAASTVGGAYKTDIGANTTAGGLLEKQYSTNVDAWNDQQKIAAQNAAGIGQFAGTVLGAATRPGVSSSAAGLMFLSSKKAKTNRKDVAEGSSLDAVNEMPVQNYDYKPGMGDGGSHVGPMAEDFQKATGRGDGTQIAAQDAIGVTMGAVKDLNKKVDRIAKAVGLGQRRQSAPARKAA
jgi:hypothetical protein